jgi:hypothetical protein
MGQPDTYTLQIRIPREQVEAALEGADATVTAEAVIERIAGMHEANLHEDLKWAVHDVAEDPPDPQLIRPFRVEYMDDDPLRQGEFVIWVDDDGDQVEREGPFATEDLAISRGISEGGRRVDESWPN